MGISLVAFPFVGIPFGGTPFVAIAFGQEYLGGGLF